MSTSETPNSSQNNPVDTVGKPVEITPEQQDYIERAAKADNEIADILKRYEVDMYTETEWHYLPKGIKVVAHIRYGNTKKITSEEEKK